MSIFETEKIPQKNFWPTDRGRGTVAANFRWKGRDTFETHTLHPLPAPKFYKKNIHVNLHGKNYIIVNKSECYVYIEIIVFRLTSNRLEVVIKIDMYNLNLEFSFFICIFALLRFIRKNWCLK